MKKKTFAVIIAILLATAIGIGIGFGLSKLKVSKSGTAEAETTEATVAGPITASFTREGITLYDDAVWEMIKKNPDRWGNAFTASYGMDNDAKSSCLEGPETGEWICCQLEIIVDNSKNDSAVSYTGFKIDNNGENEVYIQQSISSTFETVQAGGVNSVILNVFVHNADLSLDEIRDLVSQMNIQLICGPEITEFPDDDSPLIPEDETAYVVVTEA